MAECVLIRHLEAGEWDVNLRNTTTNRISQVLDDGSATLRSGQQQDVFDAQVSQTFDPILPQQGEKFHSLAASSAKAAPETPPMLTVDSEEEAELNGDDGSGSDVGGTTMTIIDSLFERRPEKNKGAIALSAKKSSGSSAKLVGSEITPKKRGSSQLASQFGSPAPDAQLKRSKTSSSPALGAEAADMDELDLAEVMEYLHQQAGYDEMEARDKELLEAFVQEPFDSHAVSAAQKKQLLASAKGLANHMSALHKKYVQFHIKMGKRSRVPTAVMTFLVGKREDIKRYTHLLGVVQEKQVELETMDNLVQPLYDRKLPIPTAIAVKHHMVGIQEAMRFSDFDTFQKLLRSDLQKCGPESLQSARKESIEMNLARVSTSMKQGANIDTQISAIDRFAEIITSEPGALSADDESALSDLSAMLQVLLPTADKANLDAAQTALSSIQAPLPNPPHQTQPSPLNPSQLLLLCVWMHSGGYFLRRLLCGQTISVDDRRPLWA